MPPKKSVSQEVLDSIRLMVGEGKTDLQIAKAMKFPLKEIYLIRRDVLRISLYGKKRKCVKCGHSKSVTCFSRESKYPDWCIICRKKYGGERGGGRASGKKEFPKICKDKKTIKVICLRCDKPFESKIFIGGGGKEDHYRLCQRCHKIIETGESSI